MDILQYQSKTITGCGVMFATRPCPPGTLFHTFVPGEVLIFSFIINKFIISNFVLHNPIHKLTRKCGFLDEMTYPADMGGRRTSLHKQYINTDQNINLVIPIKIVPAKCHTLTPAWSRALNSLNNQCHLVGQPCIK